MTAPRDVYCVLEAEHRDPAAADRVVQGRFDHTGVTLSLGTRPDWRDARLPEDEEWLIEWSKFYYGLDLAHAFASRNDSRYLHAWQNLVGSWIEQVPVDADPTDVVGRRLQNWIYAWARFARHDEFPGLPEPFAARLIESIATQTRWLRDHHAPERNHRTLELYALFIVALALPDLDPDRELTGFAVDQLHRNLLCDVLPDGVHRERSSHYHMIVLRSFLGVRENADLFGLTLPESFDVRVQRACEFAMHVHRPDGSLPMLSDSDSGSYLDLLHQAGRRYDRDDFLWAATNGREGRCPTDRSVVFPVGGYVIQRSGWGGEELRGESERHLVFDVGPLGDGGHGHYDQLSVDVAADGGAVVVDPGRYTYFEGQPNRRHAFKGTAAHNTVCVDGLDQVEYRRGKPRGALPVAEVIEVFDADGLHLVRARATSPCYDAIHERRVMLLDDDYWIIDDRLVGDTVHEYDLRWHLPADPPDAIRLRTEGRATFVETARAVLGVTGAPTVAFEDGWVAPRYGVAEPAQVISARASGHEARFTTIIVPHSARPAGPDLQIVTESGNGVRRIVIEGRVRDDVILADGPVDVHAGGVTVCARIAWIRRDRDGRLQQVTACDVERVHDPEGRWQSVSAAPDSRTWLRADIAAVGAGWEPGVSV